MCFENKILIVGLVLIVSACGQKGPLLIKSPQPHVQSIEQPELQPSVVEHKVENKKPSNEPMLEEQVQ